MGVRLARAAASIGLLAGLATANPPAQATTTANIFFVGSMTLSGPLGFSCVGPGQPIGTVDLALCSTNIGTSVDFDLPLPGPIGTVPQPQATVTHNTRGVTGFASTTCVVVQGNVNKPAKPVAHTSFACGFALDPVGSLPNTVSGLCGELSGQVNLVFNDGLGQTYKLDIHFVGPGTVVVEGHYTKMTGGGTGLVEGTIDILPPLPFPGGGSCLNKTATTFTLIGKPTLTGENLI
jgi:hypothetical protein